MYRLGVLKYLIGVIIFSAACSQVEKKYTIESPEDTKSDVKVVPNDAVIYEANIRQYSEAGDFASFVKDIPGLRDLGVDILWLMPIHPISETKRKATGDTFVSDIKDPQERKKYLGSYYSVTDYRRINSEFGTFTDFQNLMDTAHHYGIKVILDWVPNHTGWDHPWIQSHPDYYTQNDKGEIIDPIHEETGESWGWTDVADLNYNNMELHDAMIAEMKFWVDSFDVDGFRCDVAGEVPVEFWKKAISELEKDKNLFMLAESDKPELLKIGFDMGYDWSGHHLMNEIAQGKKEVQAWYQYMDELDSKYEDDDLMMNFVTNHDENSWNGTIAKRMGNDATLFTAFSFFLKGIPLIYSGQEYGLNHELKFFEKDLIPHKKGREWKILHDLAYFRKRNPVFDCDAEEVKIEKWDTESEALSLKRSCGNHNIYFVGNPTEKGIKVKMGVSGKVREVLRDLEQEVNVDTHFLLGPGQYFLFEEVK